MSANTTSNRTSIAVWGISSPVLMGDRFRITVGAKSSGKYNLRGARVAIYDQAGTEVIRGVLGVTSWPGTSGVYWAELDVTAPLEDGVVSWSVRLVEKKRAGTPRDAFCSFDVVIVRPPEHFVTVIVREKATSAPIKDAGVRVGVYRADTDESGRARVGTAKGLSEVRVWKAGYKISPRIVDVFGDSTVEIDAVAIRSENACEQWL